MSEDRDDSIQWFVLRDLTRSNAKLPAYKMLADLKFDVFTPMTRKLTIRQGIRISREVPYIHDLLFVHDRRERLDPVIARTATLQYRYIYGAYCKPMTVREDDMNRFICAVSSSDVPQYFRPEEITPSMYGRKVRIVGGNFDGYEGHLLSARGSKRRRILVELPNLITAAVEIQPDLIEVLK